MNGEEPVKKDDKEESHPAFGLVSFSRVSSSGRRSLFGTKTKIHHTSIRLKIERCVRRNTLNRDRYFPAGRCLIEVELSNMQFSELLTSMNMGMGVPCTINRLNGEEIPDIPTTDQTEIERIKDRVKNKLKGSSTKLKEGSKRVEEILGQKTILKSDREELKKLFSSMTRVFDDELPFAATMFTEAADKIEAEVKSEITGFAEEAIRSTGIKAMQVNIGGRLGLPENK